METHCVEKIELESRLTLKIYDHSKRLAGDRWLVALVAIVDIDVLTVCETGKDSGALGLDAIHAMLGNQVQYRHEKRSYFVDEKEKESVFSQLRKDFLDTNLAYLSRPDFAEKLVLRKYAEAKSTSMYGSPA